jgi:hypothetical protein
VIVNGEELTDDQLAVQQYFQSSIYHRTINQIDPFALRAKRYSKLYRGHDQLSVATTMFDWPHTGFQSFLAVCIGQGFLLCLFAWLIPIIIKLLNSYLQSSAPGFVGMTVMTQSVGFPVLTSFSFFVVLKLFSRLQ